MSYAAEPYAQFVEDLLTSLTGGVSREPFVFLEEARPFELKPLGTLVPATVTVFGTASGVYTRFVRDRDYELAVGQRIEWRIGPDGLAAAGATLPDEGSTFFVNYDQRLPGGAVPLLTDRNPGSVTRLLAESFARELAVLSRQLEAVYRAGFLDTATGRDLDQVVSLVGLARYTRDVASGSVVFSRSSPAPADINLDVLTRLSTAEAPLQGFETVTDAVLRRGALSVEVPIRALTPGPDGVVAARSIRVIHRPILGIETAVNPQATALAGEDESDEALRIRARRTLEKAGLATRGALLASLTSLPGLREKDVRIDEDHLNRPGVVIVNVAAELTAAEATRAVGALEAARPAGVRLVHNLDAQPSVVAAVPANGVDEAEAPAGGEGIVEGLYRPVKLRAVLLPASPSLAAAERAALAATARAVALAAVAEAGIGETLVYNRLVAALMAIEGVLDVALELYPKPAEGEAIGPRRQNLAPGKTLRPRLDEGDLEIEIATEIIAFDVTLKVTLSDLGKAFGALADNLENARVEIAGLLQDRIAALASPLTPAKLAGQLPPTTHYAVSDLHYTVQYLEAGLRIHEADPTLELGELERPWVRTLRLSEESG